MNTASFENHHGKLKWTEFRDRCWKRGLAREIKQTHGQNIKQEMLSNMCRGFGQVEFSQWQEEICRHRHTECLQVCRHRKCVFKLPCLCLDLLPCAWSQEGAGAASGPATVRVSGGQTASEDTHTERDQSNIVTSPWTMNLTQCLQGPTAVRYRGPKKSLECIIPTYVFVLVIMICNSF